MYLREHKYLKTTLASRGSSTQFLFFRYIKNLRNITSEIPFVFSITNKQQSFPILAYSNKEFKQKTKKVGKSPLDGPDQQKI